MQVYTPFLVSHFLAKYFLQLLTPGWAVCLGLIVRQDVRARIDALFKDDALDILYNHLIHHASCTVNTLRKYTL